jgi:hypothetical protein
VARSGVRRSEGTQPRQLHEVLTDVGAGVVGADDDLSNQRLVIGEALF